MNLFPRFCLMLRPCLQFVSRTRYVRGSLISTRLLSAAELNINPQTNLLNKDGFDIDSSKGSSAQSYDVKVTNFARRIGYLPKELPSLLTALTTKSFVDLFPSPETNHQYNGRLSLLGRSVILMFVQEHLYTTYPDLPGDALSDVSSALTNSDALRELCERLDLAGAVRATVEISTNSPSQLVSKILSDVVLAVVSTLYCDQGAGAVRKFVGEFIMSELDPGKLEEMAKLEHPKQMLCYILKNQGKPPPVARLLQTIEDSKHSPVFTVGVYSMNRLLAEGTNSSLAGAESKAVKTALLERFSKDLQRAPLPSRQENFLNEEKIEIFEADSTAET